MDAGVGVDEDTLGGETLGTVTGDGVAVIEVPVVSGVEFDLPIIVEPGGNAAVGCDGLDYSEIPVGDAESFIRCAAVR